MNSNIDIIIPYVDSRDPLWLSDFREATRVDNPSDCRFKDWGLFKYFFRAVETNLPFINNIILILARESQIPSWLDTTKVRIVYHKEFIPEEFLPAFSSCTIEAFLSNIPDLSEKLIYFNDDLFPINMMSEDDFFRDNEPVIYFLENQPMGDYMFYSQCRNGLDMITDMLNVDRYKLNEVLVPEHTALPLLKSTLIKVANANEDKIRKTITPLRSYNNINQYIYHYYQYFTNNYICNLCSYAYMDTNDDLRHIKEVMLNSHIKMICMNDSYNRNNLDYMISNIVQLFEHKFPKPSKFEL